MNRELRLCTVNRDFGKLRELGKSINFETILRSNEWNFRMILKKYPEKELVAPIAAITSNFMEQNGLQGISTDLAFAARIITIEPSWTLEDVVHFFDFILSSQHDPRLKIYGDQLPVTRLLEMVSVYEESKAIERERLVNEMKGVYTAPAPRKNSDQDIKSLMGKQLEMVNIREDKIEDTLKSKQNG